jgi:hypothetical protein
MILDIHNVTSFVSDFLTPISKVNDCCILKVDDSGYKSIVTSIDNSLVLYATYDQPNTDISEKLSLNISDISKLIKILNCLDHDNIKLEFSGNNIKYASVDINFTFHLLADNILQEPGIDITKVHSLEFDFKFSIESSSILNLIKGSTFATDSNKIYFSTSDGFVYGELTDQQKQNIDTYRQKVSEEYIGTPPVESIPVSFELIRNISSIRAENINVHLCSENKVFLFNANKDSSHVTYIASAFIN